MGDGNENEGNGASGTSDVFELGLRGELKFIEGGLITWRGGCVAVDK